MPPPPKPGVIPLGPLSLGDILGGAFSALGRHWKQLFGMALVAYGLAALAMCGAAAIAVAAVHDHLVLVFDTTGRVAPARSDVQPVVIAGAVVVVVAMVMWLVAMAWVYSAVPAVLQDAVLGRSTTFATVWRKAWSRFPAVLGVVAVQWAAMLAMALLFVVAPTAMFLSTSRHHAPSPVPMLLFALAALVLMPVGTWLWVRYGFAPAIAVLEKQRPVQALRRSAHLVKDAWWRSFGILILVTMMSGVIGYFIQLPFTYGGLFAAMPLTLGDHSTGGLVSAVAIIVVLYLVGMVISQFVSTTLPQLAAGLLYIDQRVRREDLAPALADAAGVPRAPAGPTGTW
ncbi:hypothetical protein DWB77_05824 [Streptomyces hundungensis]|uniref:Glycerophosphoryl diester phosphodiesterase membrane domain-containing protein n=1 Tax=Streptomyces hundungensis TaxID=1077946 RepID=A0A387HIE2_9ACTN|nr:hypothetical protein [Streptomyces hundungensis]AYG83626.1 hypothetical protein DWB77_05824 [Streptomyces hundungensis]